MANEIISDSLDIPGWLVTPNTIAALKTGQDISAGAIQTLTDKADSLLSVTPESVMDKKPLPPSGDRHDYLSLAIYVWPNPEKPDGLPYIHKDGLVNPEIHEYDLPRLRRTTTRIETLALAALYSGNMAYADKATELMRVWFLDPATAMNPHLDFGQFVPGECDGRCYGIIETTNLIRIINAVYILECLPGYDYGCGEAIRQWFKEYTIWLKTSKLGTEEGNTTNNHRAWYMTQLAAYLSFIGQQSETKNLLQEMYPDILEQQMAADGSMPRELARTRSYHYCVFVMIPLLMCVDMGRELNLDLAGVTSSNGGNIHKAMQWFLPYLVGDKVWNWEQIVAESPYAEAYPLLRMAGNVLGDQRYEAALKKLAGEEYGQLLQNLIIPANLA